MYKTASKGSYYLKDVLYLSFLPCRAKYTASVVSGCWHAVMSVVVLLKKSFVGVQYRNVSLQLRANGCKDYPTAESSEKAP